MRIRTRTSRATIILFVISVALLVYFSDAPAGLPTNPGDAKDYSSLKIAPPRGGGMYLGQTQYFPGEVATFERAIGRKAAVWAPEPTQSIQVFAANGRVTFDPEAAERAWKAGKMILVQAYEAYGNPAEYEAGAVDVDRLLRGEYEEDLVKLAAEFRSYGKPMFFHAGRELNGIGSDYFGGFGANGNKSMAWALRNQKGLAEFDPSKFPNARLYHDLGDPNVSDGVERLTAAQRYYYDFFVRREGLTFLTFDSMGWAAGNEFESHVSNRDQLWNLIVSEFGISLSSPEAIEHAGKLLRSSYDFSNFYPGDDYVDWVSLTWYILYPAQTEKALRDFDITMGKVRKMAANKPVLLIEPGFPDGKKPSSTIAAESVRAGLRKTMSYPEIHGFAMWSKPHPESWGGGFPYDSLIRPGTLQGTFFRNIVQGNSDYFHSCICFPDGSRMPNCD